jgi:hypothetical protein
VTTQQYETTAELISSLNIKRYQDLLATPLVEGNRQAIQMLLREEEVWMKNHTPPFCTVPASSRSHAGTTRGGLRVLREQRNFGR